MQALLAPRVSKISLATEDALAGLSTREKEKSTRLPSRDVTIAQLGPQRSTHGLRSILWPICFVFRRAQIKGNEGVKAYLWLEKDRL